MMNWDSRMRNNQSVQMLKAAIPFLDIGVGENIDLAGLLRAVRPFAGIREGRVMDMMLQFFQIRDMMHMVQLMQSMQQVSEDSGEDAGASGPFAGFGGGFPSPELFDLIQMFLRPEDNAGQEENESVDL